MQTMPDERPSLTRMLSCGRHSKKVSCETLSLNDFYLQNNLQSESQSFYYSDGEKDNMQEGFTAGDNEANELENPNDNYCYLANEYRQHARWLEEHSGKPDKPSYGDGKAARDNFFSRCLFKVSHTPAASHAKEVERLRKHLRTHPTCRTGGALPSSGPILLHIGSHSSTFNSKASAILRASSIIPRDAVAGKMNASAGEPSSPKVTCLGRVRNKQKHLGKCTSIASKDTEGNQVDVCCTSMLRRREKKKKADRRDVESASKKEKKTSRMGSGGVMVGDNLVAQSKKTFWAKSSEKRTAQSSGGKGAMSSKLVAKEESKLWSMREITKLRESEIDHKHQQSWQGIEDTSALRASSSEVSVDLSRFGSESQRLHEMMVVTSLVGNDSQRFEQDDKEDFVQAALENALLLIKNRKANDQQEVGSSSVAPAALPNRQDASLPAGLDDHAINKTTGTQFSIPTSRLHRYGQDLQTMPEAEMKKPVMITDILGGRASSLMMQGASSTTCKSGKLQSALQAQHSGGNRQASLQKQSPESSIWQRRAIEKPCALGIKSLSKRNFNQRTTIKVNKY